MSMKKTGPAYTIRTRRLILRCWTPVDAPALHAAVEESRGHLAEWMPWAAGSPEKLQAVIDRIRHWQGEFNLGIDFVYGIFNLDESRVLGGAGLHTRRGDKVREIGYWIHRDHINQGLATETAAALARVAFEIDCVQRVEIHCDPENVRSAAVPRKLGFVHEATLRRRVVDSTGNLRDSMLWTLLDDEYPGSPASRAQIEAFDAMYRSIL